MPAPNRRAPGFVPTFAGKPWSSITGSLLDDVLRRLQQGYAGIPGGFFGTVASVIQAGVAASAGLLSSGWAAADHVHDAETAAPTNPTGKTSAEGSSTALMRADATITQGIVTTKGDILTHDASTAERLPVGANDRVLMADSAETTGLIWATLASLIAKLGLAGVPAWTKITVGSSAFNVAALTNDIALYNLPAGGVVHAVKVKHSIIFAGPGIIDYKVSVGIVGNLIKYTAPFDVDTAVTDTNFQLTATVGSEDHGASAQLRIAAVSAGANLDQAVTGAVEVWVLTSVAV